jgi:hypothetical protein
MKCARSHCNRRHVRLYPIKADVRVAPVSARLQYTGGTADFHVAGGGSIAAKLPLCPRHALRVSLWGFGPWKLKTPLAAEPTP